MSQATATHESPYDAPERLVNLLAAHAPRPYVFYSARIGEAALERFAVLSALRMLRDPNASLVMEEQHGELAGLACWSRLAWDSERFGFPAARLNLLVHAGEYAAARDGKSGLLARVLCDCGNAGIRHLTARVDSGDLASIHTLEQAGFEMIDGIQTSSLSLADTRVEPSRNGLHLRLFSPGDLDGVLAIARSSYVYDRFHADRALSPAVADAVNEAWLRNSCLGTAADAVVIAADGADVLGYVTCRIDAETGPGLGLSIGTIVMVATAAAARGRGVGRAASFGALDWFAARGIDVVEVGTQLRNIPAARLYASCGFRPMAVSFTFRKIL